MGVEWNSDPDRWYEWALGRYLNNHFDHEDSQIHNLASVMESRGNYWHSQVFDSPIEQIFFAFALFASDGFEQVLFVEPGAKCAVGEFGTQLERQVGIGKYKVDFLFTTRHAGYSRHLVVECDGHDFHDRTKEQAAYDKRRDRELIAAGHQVMRFTGSELYRDPVKCISEVEYVLHDLLCECLADSGVIARRGQK